jgi:hypothetical protein
MGSTTARAGVQFPVVAGSSLLLSIKAGSAAYLVSYSMGNDGSSPRVKQLGNETDH